MSRAVFFLSVYFSEVTKGHCLQPILRQKLVCDVVSSQDHCRGTNHRHCHHECDSDQPHQPSPMSPVSWWWRTPILSQTSSRCSTPLPLHLIYSVERMQETTAVFVDVFCPPLPCVMFRHMRGGNKNLSQRVLLYKQKEASWLCWGICLFLATTVVWPAFYFGGRLGDVRSLEWWLIWSGGETSWTLTAIQVSSVICLGRRTAE